MSKPPDTIVELSPTLSLCEYQSGGHKGFWLYDETRGMNLAMRAPSERDALVDALDYYQDRLSAVEQEYRTLKGLVDAFVSQFVEDEDYQ